jgi:hypothetical protein
MSEQAVSPTTRLPDQGDDSSSVDAVETRGPEQTGHIGVSSFVTYTSRSQVEQYKVIIDTGTPPLRQRSPRARPAPPRKPLAFYASAKDQ